MKKNLHYILVALLICVFTATAQDGQLDMSFGTNGSVQTDFFDFADQAWGMDLQNDNKIVVAGSAETDFNINLPSLARYLPDGSLDASFGDSGVVTTDYGSNGGDRYWDVLVQLDQKIIAGGNFGGVDESIMVARYLENGDLDTNFGSSGIVSLSLDEVEFGHMALQTDQKILVGGTTKPAGTREILLLRYLPDGSLDTSFGSNGVVMTNTMSSFATVARVMVMNDGKMLVGARTSNGYKLFKYLPDGNLDMNFGTDGILSTGYAANNNNSFDVTAEGKIFVGVATCDGESCQSYLLTYLPNGDPDSEFGNDGVVTVTIPDYATSKIMIQENQRVLILGFVPDFFEGGETLITRYWLNGGLDVSFGSAGQVRSWDFLGTDIISQNDGKLLHLGTTWWYDGDEDFILRRYFNDPLSVEKDKLNELTVFPNPTKDFVTLQYDYIQTEGIDYQINDISGKLLQEGTLSGDSHQIDLSGFGSGLYFLNASNTTIRLIKN